jgi:filamentous hemagglutinin family protein
MKHTIQSLGHKSLRLALSAALLSSASPFGAYGNPVDGVVSGGAAVISSHGNEVRITQSTNRAVIDWRGFDIAPHETTRFIQPNSGSWTLNRVNAATPSLIQGNLIANGNIAIINPNGVVFSGTSRVDAAGLVASTANISNANFMAGQMKFDQAGNTHAKIVNEGHITAREAGLVGLVAPHVENSGVIEARLGKVALAAGETFTLDMAGDGLIEVAIGDGVAAGINHSGSIQADGGSVLITAAAGRQVVDSLIKISGDVVAKTVGEKNGEIVIYAEGANAVAGNDAAHKGQKSGKSVVEVSGRLRAGGDETGEKGGSVRVLGDVVALTGAALVDATGDAGGGDIKIGGDYQGNGVTPASKATYIGADVTIKANAANTGNGGRIITWSDGDTGFYGMMEAKGGAVSGHGGFVEVSGKQWLDFQGLADVRANNGTIGTLLLDPTDITISTGGNTATWTGSQFQGAGASSILNVTTLQNQLALSDVTITTASGGGGNGDITVADSFTWSSGRNLTMIADRDINVNADILYTGAGPITTRLSARNDINFSGGADLASTNTGRMNIILASNSDNVGAGRVNLFSAGTQILSKDGDITIGGGNAMGTGYALGAVGNQQGIVMSNVTIDAGDWGNIEMRGRLGTANGGYAGGVDIEYSTIQTGMGNITILGATSATGNSNNYGVKLKGGVLQSTIYGNLFITATNTVGGTSSHNIGMRLEDGAIVRAATTGVVDISATGGTGTGGNNYGFTMDTNTPSVMADAGIMGVTGIGGSGGTNNHGIYIAGGSGGFQSNNHTVYLTGRTTGVGTGIVSDGVVNKTFANAGTGALYIITDSLDFSTTATHTISGSDVYIQPNTAGTTVGVGSGAGALQLTDNFLSNVSWTNLLQIGKFDSGNITINSNHAFNGNMTIYSGSALSVTGGTLSATSAGAKNWNFRANDSIDFSGSADITATTGSINLVLNSNYDDAGVGRVALGAGTNITTNGGDIAISGGSNYLTGRASGTSGLTVNASGVSLADGSSLNAGGGDILIRGIGFNSINASNAGYGIYLDGDLSTNGVGAITLDGIGGSSTASGATSSGVALAGNITAVDGLIDITGVGGTMTQNNTTNIGIWSFDLDADIISNGSGGIRMLGTGGSGPRYTVGVELSAGSTTTTGTGNIDITGNGSTNNNLWSYGVGIWGGHTISSTASGATAGNITIAGTAGSGTAAESPGVLIGLGFPGFEGIVTTVDGDISITGSRPGVTALTDAHGIWFYGGDGSKIESTGAGNITLQGSTASASSQGIYMGADNVIGHATSTGDITIIADTLETNGASIITTNDIAVRNLNAATTIGIGAGMGGLSISNAELGGMNGGLITIGQANAGLIDINTAYAFDDAMQFVSNAGIQVNSTLSTAAASDGAFDFQGPTTVNFNVNTSNSSAGLGTITLGASAHTLGANLITDDSNITINGATTLAGAAGVTRTINAGAGNINIGLTGSIAAGTRNLDLIARDLEIQGAITGGAGQQLTIRQFESNRSLGLGGAGGIMSLVDSELDFISGWGTLNLGRNDSTAGVFLNNYTWNNIGNVNITTGSGNIEVNQSQQFNAVNVNFSTNGDLVLGANIAGTGNLTIVPVSNGTSIGIGGGAGVLNLSDTELDFIVNGWSSIAIGATTGTGVITIDQYNNWKDPITFRNGATGSIVVTGEQSTTAGSNAAFAFNGPTTFNANVNTSNSSASAGTITLGNFSHTLGANLTTDDSNITINGATALSGAAGVLRTINAGTGALNIASTASIAAGTRNLMLVADNMDIQGAITGANNRQLDIRQSSINRSIGLGGAAGGLQLDDSELDQISGWGTLNIGLSWGSGAMDMGGYTWNNADAVQLSTGSGQMTVSQAQTFNGGTTVFFTDSDIAINDSITGSGYLYIVPSTDATSIGVGGGAGALNLSDAELGRLTDGWASIAIGSLTGTGTMTVDGYANWRDPIVFRMGSSGSIIVNDTQGTSALSDGSFIFNGPTTFNANVDTSNSALGDGAITLGSFNHSLGADLITNGSAINILGATTLSGAAGVTRTINAGSSAITVVGAGALAAGDKNLTLISDDIMLSGNVSGTGDLVLRQFTNGRSMNLAGAAGNYGLSAAEIARIQSGFNQVYVGDINTGAMNLGTAAWASPVTFRNGNAVMTLSGAVSSTAVGPGTVMTFVTDGGFTETAGGDLNAGTGRWLIYADTPSEVSLIDLASDFRRYNCTYGGACGALSANGDELLYESAPTLVVRANDYIRAYGDANALGLGGYTVDMSSLESGDTLGSIGFGGTATFNTAIGQFANAGTYAGAATITGGLSNTAGYTISYIAGDMVITKRDITATVASTSRGYGQSNPVLGSTSVIWGNLAPGGDTATDINSYNVAIAPSASATALPGSTHAITISGFNDNNYNLASVTPGILTITGTLPNQPTGPTIPGISNLDLPMAMPLVQTPGRMIGNRGEGFGHRYERGDALSPQQAAFYSNPTTLPYQFSPFEMDDNVFIVKP